MLSLHAKVAIMKIILFGATGMVGSAALLECLNSHKVTEILTIGRRATGKSHPKLREIEHQDLSDFTKLSAQLSGYDACFYCVGIASAGLSEQEYQRVTHDFTLAAAKVLAAQNPAMTFVFISAAGADSTEQGRIMWARIKGKTENALLKMPFKRVYAFRPAIIQPQDGIVSRTTLYRVSYRLLSPVLPLIKKMFPKHFITTREMGRALLNVAENGAPKAVLESFDIRELGQSR